MTSPVDPQFSSSLHSLTLENEDPYEYVTPDIYQSVFLRDQEVWIQKIPTCNRFSTSLATETSLLKHIPATELNTWNIIHYQLLRKLLLALGLGCVRFSVFKRKWRDWAHFGNLFWTKLVHDAKLNQKVLENPLAIVRLILDFVYFAYAVLILVYPLVVMMINKSVHGFAPQDLPRIPFVSTPTSIALILSTELNKIAPPPPVPQPYLDADRNIQVPNMRKLKTVLSLRNEYLTLYCVHTAAEKVRLLSCISKFVVWGSILTKTSSLTVYEQYGLLWKQTGAASGPDFRVIGDAILFELDNVIKTHPRVPNITLIDPISGTRHILFKTGKVELKVYFCDYRSRKLSGNIEHLPETADLTIVPRSGLGYHMVTNGYICAPSRRVGSFYYGMESFTFKLFLNSLNYFAITGANTSLEN
ncbi:uncharacterized protein CANTADRAFT_21069 [Suhomyces tanzawaensis NRRL Y-17324]|uniref:Uncharacterized protein n=1 Tax=Suhomyces tanzawaensis NRRL Y-17324 TaxID=984487 RepID=A0A1E4SJV8_9ASCO|nr:uncharacterized protein CANTADRAFT_21069 [Suhomyces tanzawaensis NRRL Y-17324]ODV79780.1 hypothetical protein CANTADRAFT_21069 [Suhomyces tanzawaensis NRRL Y-17324]